MDKIAELENNWKRALADYQNLVKRTAEEREDFVKFANQGLISRLIFVLDSLEMLQQHSDDQGLALILKEFKQTLTDEGLEEIEAQDKEFDQTTMEAIELLETNNEDEIGKVLEVVQKGYKLKQKVIRPAKVKVGAANRKDDDANASQ